MKRIFLTFALLGLSVCMIAEEVDAAQLRGTMRETSLVLESSAKAKADFESEKAQLEMRIKLLDSLKGKLAADIEKEKAAIKGKKDANAGLVKEMEAYADFEKKLSETLAQSGMFGHKEYEDAYAAAKDIFMGLKDSIKASDELYIMKAPDGTRILVIGCAAVLSEKDSPEAAKVCDMLEGKIPFDIVRIRINGKAAE